MVKIENINNIDFAKRESELKGVIPVKAMPRLLEVLSPNEKMQDITYRLKGSSKIHAYPSLVLKVEATLAITCQRCLEAMPLLLSLTYDYVIDKEVPEELEESDDIDWLEPSEDMDVLELIEDELLISVPFAPLHSEPCKVLKKESGEKVSPFAVLKGKF